VIWIAHAKIIKNMKTIVFVLLIAFNASQAFAKNDVGVYTYTELTAGFMMQLNTIEMTISNGHNVISVKDCKDKLGYKCMVAKGPFFIFPTSNISVGMGWEHEGQRFNVVRKVDRQILGKKYAVFIIEQKDGDDTYWYLFSREVGLLAFGVKNSKLTSTFILNERCGFAASNRCKNYLKTKSKVGLD